jgi:peptidoglycan/xylan/chitin deacetylase (PgdA/CDA1 family)
MGMYSRVRSLLITLDRFIAQFPLALGNEDGVLLSFLFHSLYLVCDEPRSGLVDPQQEITVEMFRRFIDHFQGQSYVFVSPADIVGGLRPGGKYILISFDDGYYNNVRALPVLTEFNVPAVFFVCTGHVKNGKGFWWDAAQREGHRRGVPKGKIDRLFDELKKLRTSEAEAKLREEFGPAVLTPAGDLDRPFTPAELKDFAQHRLVSLGNHTRDHAILTNYSDAEVRAEILGAQEDLLAMTGKTAEMIAYPVGNESPAIVDAARSAGLRLGVTVNPGRNRLPILPDSPMGMTLKRFTLHAGNAIEAQCRMSRSGVSLYRSVRNAKLKKLLLETSGGRPEIPQLGLRNH